MSKLGEATLKIKADLDEKELNRVLQKGLEPLKKIEQRYNNSLNSVFKQNLLNTSNSYLNTIAQTGKNFGMSFAGSALGMLRGGLPAIATVVGGYLGVGLIKKLFDTGGTENILTQLDKFRQTLLSQQLTSLMFNTTPVNLERLYGVLGDFSMDESTVGNLLNIWNMLTFDPESKSGKMLRRFDSGDSTIDLLNFLDYLSEIVRTKGLEAAQSTLTELLSKRQAKFFYPFINKIAEKKDYDLAESFKNYNKLIAFEHVKVFPFSNEIFNGKSIASLDANKDFTSVEMKRYLKKAKIKYNETDSEEDLINKIVLDREIQAEKQADTLIDTSTKDAYNTKSIAIVTGQLSNLNKEIPDREALKKINADINTNIIRRYNNAPLDMNKMLQQVTNNLNSLVETVRESDYKTRIAKDKEEIIKRASELLKLETEIIKKGGAASEYYNKNKITTVSQYMANLKNPLSMETMETMNIEIAKKALGLTQTDKSLGIEQLTNALEKNTNAVDKLTGNINLGNKSGALENKINETHSNNQSKHDIIFNNTQSNSRLLKNNGNSR